MSSYRSAQQALAALIFLVPMGCNSCQCQAPERPARDPSSTLRHAIGTNLDFSVDWSTELPFDDCPDIQIFNFSNSRCNGLLVLIRKQNVRNLGQVVNSGAGTPPLMTTPELSGRQTNDHLSAREWISRSGPLRCLEAMIRPRCGYGR